MNKNDDSGPKRPGRVLISMPDDLRAAIQKEAFVHDRTLTAEVNKRLRESLDGYGVRQVARGYGVMESSGLEVTAVEKTLLAAFRGLPSEKQKALLALLK